MATGGDNYSNIGSEDLCGSLQCEPCRSKSDKIIQAVGMCTTCQEYLCHDCFKIHKIPTPMQKHELFTREQMAQSGIQLTRKDICTEKCDIHTDEVIKYFCLDHKEIGCTACITLNHKPCKRVKYITNILADLQTNQMFNNISMELDGLENKASKVTVQANQVDAKVENASSATLDEITSLHMDMKQVIVKNEMTMKQEAIELTNQEKKDLNKIIAQANQLKHEIQKMRNIAKALKQDKQNSNLFIHMVNISKLFESLQSQLGDVEHQLCFRNWSIRFNPNNKTLYTLKASAAFGVISFGPLEINSLKYQRDITVNTPMDKSICWVTGSVLLPDDKVALADCYNSEVKLVDLQANIVTSSVNLPSTSKPWDITLIDDTQIAVTLPAKQQIAFLILDQTSISFERCVDVKGNCRGIDYRQGELAVSYVRPSKIEILSLQGNVMQKISHQLSVHAKLFHGPYYIAFGTSAQVLYVSNFFNNTVSRLNINSSSGSTITAVYSHGKFKRPEKILFDEKHGAIYVCASRSHAVHKLSPDLRHVRVLLANNIKYPYSISFNSMEGTLYVGQRESNILKEYQAVLDFQI